MRDISITKEAHDKLWGYIDGINTEIGGFGFIEREGDEWIWHDTFLVDQVVSHADVDYTDEAFVQALERAEELGVLDSDSMTWVMWHSHNTMQAYWSSTDVKDQIKVMRDKSGVSHLVSFVGNHKHEYDLRLDLFDHPLVPHIHFTGLDLVVEQPTGLMSEIEADIKKHVTKWSPRPMKQLTPPPPRKSVSSDWWDEIDWDELDEKAVEDAIVDYYNLQPLSNDERNS